MMVHNQHVVFYSHNRTHKFAIIRYFHIMIQDSAPINFNNIFLRIHPFQKLILSFILAGIAYYFVKDTHLNRLLHIMVAWDVCFFDACYQLDCCFYKVATTNTPCGQRRRWQPSLFLCYRACSHVCKHGYCFVVDGFWRYGGCPQINLFTSCNFGYDTIVGDGAY